MKTNPTKKNIFRRFKDSIYTRPLNPDNDRDRILVSAQSFIFHLHPKTAPEKSLKLSVTWGLGGILALLLTVQAVTGSLLRFVYSPTPEKAYDSILFLKSNFIFGDFVRNIHHWSGTFLIIIALLHLARVFFTGAYRGKRQFTWVLGVALFLLLLASNFTGYLLPWDQLSYWAVTVGTNAFSYIPFAGDKIVEIIRGGKEVGEATLLTFYTFHTGILPLALMVFSAFHFWRIRKAGGVVFPDYNSETNKTVTVIPHLVAREFIAALVVIAVLSLFAVFFDAPLLEKANPAFSPNPIKAPWYFQGIQELMLHLHPFFAAVVIPLTIVIILFALPYLEYDSDQAGVWFLSDTGKRTAKLSTAAGIIFSFLFIFASKFFMDFSLTSDSVPSIVASGLIPFLFSFFLLFLYYKFIKTKFNANRAETNQALFVLLLSTFVIFSLINLFFRGEGMKLIFPFG